MTTVAETEARINQMLADTLLKLTDTVKREQDIRYAPVTLLLTGIGTGAALVGASLALLKWIG